MSSYPLSVDRKEEGKGGKEGRGKGRRTGRKEGAREPGRRGGMEERGTDEGQRGLTQSVSCAQSQMSIWLSSGQ